MKCKKPIPIKKRGPSGIKNIVYYVGCGKCVACMEKRRNEISLRNYFELLDCGNRATFITLTYNDDNLPYLNGSPSLCMRDFQLFMKRLRKSLQPEKVRFYGCGVYGPITHRPHYHVIIYNLKFTYDLHQKLEKIWSKGFVQCRACDLASIRYTSKYMLTKLLGDWEPPTREFHLSSRNPGIGLPYLARHPEFKTIFVDNLNDYYTMPGGYRLRLDRYLRDKIFCDTDKISLRQKYEEYYDKHYLDEIREFEALFPDLVPGTDLYIDTAKKYRSQKYNNWERIKLKSIIKSHIL